MYYEIVPMDRSHIDQIAALERECFSTPWSETMLSDALFDPQASFIGWMCTAASAPPIWPSSLWRYGYPTLPPSAYMKSMASTRLACGRDTTKIRGRTP